METPMGIPTVIIDSSDISVEWIANIVSGLNF